MNKAQIEALIKLFEDEIDTILESLNVDQKNQIFEFYSFIVNANLDQNELTRLARAYAGNRSQSVIDNVNRLRSNLILLPAANQRVHELDRLAPGLTLQSYFNLLHASILSYITSALQNHGLVTDLMREIQVMQESKAKLEKDNQESKAKFEKDIEQYKASVTVAAKYMEAAKTEKGKLEQEKISLQDQLAEQVQKAEQGAKAEAARQHLQRELMELKSKYEAISLPLKLQEELKEKETTLQELLDEIKRNSLHEAELRKEQSGLKTKLQGLQAGQDQIPALTKQLEEEKNKQRQQEADINEINQQIIHAETDDEVKNLQENLLTLMGTLRTTNSNIKRFEADLMLKKSNQQAYLIEKNKLNDLEKNIAKLAETKAKQEQSVSKLKQEIEALQSRPNVAPQAALPKLTPVTMPKAASTRATEGHQTPPQANHSPFNHSNRTSHSGASQDAKMGTSRILPKTPLPPPINNNLRVDKNGNKTNKISIDQLINPLDFDDIKGALESGRFDINSCDKEGRNLLHHACLTKSWIKYQLAELLLSFSINTDMIDVTGKKPIQYAELYGDIRLVEIITNYTKTAGIAPRNMTNHSPGFFKTPSTLQNCLSEITQLQQNQYSAHQTNLLDKMHKLQQEIEQRGEKIIEQMEQLRSNNGLASYDLSGQASPTLANICLAENGDILARLRQCLEDALESTSNYKALYHSQFIALLLNKALSHSTAQFKCLAPVTVNQSYQTAEILQPSIKNQLTSRLNCIPLHINSNHWVVLLVQRIGEVYHINYIDPYGNKMDGNLRVRLQEVFGVRLRVIESTINLQPATDAINCGAYAVEICRALRDLAQFALIDSEILNKRMLELKQNSNINDIRISHVEIANQALHEILLQLGEPESKSSPPRRFSRQ